MVLVERLEDGGAAEGVAGEEHVVHVDPPAEGGQVELILMLAEGGLLSRVCLLNPGYPIKYQVTLVYPILPLPLRVSPPSGSLGLAMPDKWAPSSNRLISLTASWHSRTLHSMGAKMAN